MKQLVDFFNQPFPEDQTWYRKLVGNIVIAVFIALFLYVFAPFGLGFVPGGLLRHALAYGGITLAVCIGFNALYHLLGIQTDVPSWTLGKWTVGVLCLILAIGGGNAWYTTKIGGGDMSMPFVLGMLGRTAMVAFFPVVGTGLLKIRSRAAHYNEVSTDIKPTTLPAEQDLPITIVGKDGEAIFESDKSELLFVESQKNYILIHRRASDEPIKIRSTLANVIDHLQEQGIMRCHRSFAVNVSAIEEVSGNAQGLRLHVADTDQIVPVSRSYVTTIRAALV